MGDLTANFNRAEFACPCCRQDNISEDLVAKLQTVRTVVGKPMRITSAVRCIRHNHAVGGVVDSAHYPRDGNPGYAADIEIVGGDKWYKFISAFTDEFKRIGIYPYNNFIHVDVDPDKPQEVIWFGK